MRYLPQVLAATLVVVLVPVAATLGLHALGVISSPWLSMALAGGLSFAASLSGRAYWRKRRGGAELLFSELLPWGWVRRWRQDRRVAEATARLGLGDSDGPAGDQLLSVARREQFLAQLADALEAQDPYLRGHSRRVARHAAMIARRLGLPNDEVDRVRAAAVVHDVGKLRTPPAILNRPGRLSDAEFQVIKLHAVNGASMVAVLDDPQLTGIVRHHHERLDGTGYPDRLSGEAIPLGARIIAVADTFDAVTSSRPYRSAARHQRAIDILREESGSKLDPAAVHAFVEYYSNNRTALWWAIASATLRRAISWLHGEPAAAAPVSSGKFAATALVTAAIGSTAALAPIAALNTAGMLAASPSVTAPRGKFGSGWPVQRSGQAPARQGQSHPASGLPLASARTTSPTQQARAARTAARSAPISFPAHSHVTSLANNLPVHAPTVAATVFAPASLAAPSSNTTPTSAANPTNPRSGSFGEPSTQNPLTATPPGARPKPNASRPHGSGTGNGSGNPNGRGPDSSHPNASPRNSREPHTRGNAYGRGSGGGQSFPNAQGNAYGHGTGGQSNSNAPGNAYGHGTGAQSNSNAPGNADGHGTGAPSNPNAPGKAHPHAAQNGSTGDGSAGG